MPSAFLPKKGAYLQRLGPFISCQHFGCTTGQQRQQQYRTYSALNWFFRHSSCEDVTHSTLAAPSSEVWTHRSGSRTSLNSTDILSVRFVPGVQPVVAPAKRGTAADPIVSSDNAHLRHQLPLQGGKGLAVIKAITSTGTFTSTLTCSCPLHSHMHWYFRGVIYHSARVAVSSCTSQGFGRQHSSPTSPIDIWNLRCGTLRHRYDTGKTIAD